LDWPWIMRKRWKIERERVSVRVSVTFIYETDSKGTRGLEQTDF
jgi:hypothetical protein